jgi:hypothetical protein
MSEAKFTKGPWEVDQQVNKISWILSAEDDFNKAVAKVTQYGSIDTSTMNANAYLIAAAPDMYAFISKMALALSSDYPALRDSALEILAKARGE